MTVTPNELRAVDAAIALLFAFFRSGRTTDAPRWVPRAEDQLA